ncbi:hypothetical protein EDC01DRAFT_724796 [Geopyxis carbonaria]|nr:hypothetical protein EDC01DRAFT_724796 [Geopyxis carbonaria]
MAAGECTACKAPPDAAARIADLEVQVQLLSSKAAQAADKLSQTEQELTLLRAGPTSPTSTSATSPTSPTATTHATLTAPAPAATRLSSFLSASLLSRRSTTLGPPSPPPECSPADLARERALRIKAEERLAQVTGELEDLSASLFQSANEMVADERRARSKLEERVVVLERRERDKRERLGVLERAVDRISRVREMLTGGGGGGRDSSGTAGGTGTAAGTASDIGTAS